MNRQNENDIVVHLALDAQSEQVLVHLEQGIKLYHAKKSLSEQIEAFPIAMIECLIHLLSNNIKTAPEQIILTRFMEIARGQNAGDNADQFNYQYYRFLQEYSAELLLRSFFLQQLIQMLKNKEVHKTANVLLLIQENERVLKQSMGQENFLHHFSTIRLGAEHIPFLLNQYPVNQWHSVLQLQGLQAHFNQYFTRLEILFKFLQALTSERRLEFLKNYWLRKRLIRLINRSYAADWIARHSEVNDNKAKFLKIIINDPLDLVLDIDAISDLYFDITCRASLSIAMRSLSNNERLFFLNLKKVSASFIKTIETSTDFHLFLFDINKEDRLTFIVKHPYLLSLFKQSVVSVATNEKSIFLVNDMFKLDPELYYSSQLFTQSGASLEVMKTVLQTMDEAYARPKDEYLIAADRAVPGYDRHDRILYRALLHEIQKQTPQPPRNNFERSLDTIKPKNLISHIVHDQNLLNELLGYIKDYPCVFISLFSAINDTELNDLQILAAAMKETYKPVTLAPQPSSRFHYLHFSLFSQPPQPAQPPVDYRYEVYHSDDIDFYRQLNRQMIIKQQVEKKAQIK